MQHPGQLVYGFGHGRNDGRADMARVLGGKGAHLAEMADLGIPVPPGFTITTEVCSHFQETDGGFPHHLVAQVDDAVAAIETALGMRFGSSDRPLLVSVRSGAPVSMPGMMDTVLNLGLNDTTVEGLAAELNDPRAAWDAYRRFVHMYADVVMGVASEHFEEAIASARDAYGVVNDHELTADAVRELVATYRRITRDHSGRDIPSDPTEQLWQAIAAVFRSWSSDRAVIYRRHHGIPDSLGTAVTIQSMVFGNAGPDCATGVAFTRNPATGERALYGEFLVNAQGEDVVAGIRTPDPITCAAAQVAGVPTTRTMEALLPDAYAQLERTCAVLEHHYRDAQDVEFTVQHGHLWMLQTRTAKRTAAAAIQIAVDMVHEGLISQDEAVVRVDAASLDQLLHPSFDPDAAVVVLATGMPASPGAASGRIALDAATAVRMAADEPDPVLLVRTETSPEDIEGMIAARGILTARGGMTSHAAVVARGMGTTCVSGCSDLVIDTSARTITIAGTQLREGDFLSIDGSSGAVIAGCVPTVEPELGGSFEQFMAWAGEARALAVRANADTPHDAQLARSFGAEGIGLCRTEHMFFEADRVMQFRRMILAPDAATREGVLTRLLDMQRADFAAIFSAMDGFPVTVRLLDPPLHEFLPHPGDDLSDLIAATGMRGEQITAAINQLREANPMLGHRGCRLGITTPEIYRMQARAIALATIDCAENGIDARPEIMIPLIGSAVELDIIARDVRAVLADVATDRGVTSGTLDIPVGTMIEIPRACLTAGQVAGVAQFFSFGTNDLTQLTYGFSRDDAGSFLGTYVERGILPVDPFQRIDPDGVGMLMRMAVDQGRSARADLKIGLCGEHGGDPTSVAFCSELGLDYVSCSAYRVPIARLAAAQAAIQAHSSHQQSRRFVRTSEPRHTSGMR